MTLPKPTDQTTLVLRKLLTKSSVSFKDFPTGFRLGARIFDLRRKYGLENHITTSDHPFKNQFGHNGSYAKYTLTNFNEKDRHKTIQTYINLVSEN
jgi:hypothetical protein